METPTLSKPPKDKTYSIIILTLMLFLRGINSTSSHTVYNITWTLSNLLTGNPINRTSQLSTLKGYFPDIWFDTYQLMMEGDVFISPRGIYVCPGSGRYRGKVYHCNGPEIGYCANWGCETTGTTSWGPSSNWDLITVKEVPGSRRQAGSCAGKDCGTCLNGSMGRCNLHLLSFTQKGKNNLWHGTKTWGLHLYSPGRDPFALFSLSRSISSVSASHPVGPNQVLSNQRPPTSRASAPRPILITKESFTRAPTMSTPLLNNLGTTIITNHQEHFPGTEDRLINLIRGAYQALNYSDPNRAKDCWLCLNSGPPYYEGIATMRNFTNHTSSSAICFLLPHHKLTLPEVSGQGTCLGKVPKSHQTLCIHTVQNLTPGDYYLMALNGTFWACNTGLTPCISAQIWNQTKEYCILVQLWPRITYHDSETIYKFFEGTNRYQREPITMTLAVLLGTGGIIVRIGTGTQALL